jgi:hypothetical protein
MKLTQSRTKSVSKLQRMVIFLPIIFLISCNKERFTQLDVIMDNSSRQCSSARLVITVQSSGYLLADEETIGQNRHRVVLSSGLGILKSSDIVAVSSTCKGILPGERAPAIASAVFQVPVARMWYHQVYTIEVKRTNDGVSLNEVVKKQP